MAAFFSMSKPQNINVIEKHLKPLIEVNSKEGWAGPPGF
jgi:hypothetical protein